MHADGSGIGTVVFGITEKYLAELTGDNPEYLTLDLTRHTVFASGRHNLAVKGPVPELEAEILAAQESFWWGVPKSVKREALPHKLRTVLQS